jgi:hypothetical protein
VIIPKKVGFWRRVWTGQKNEWIVSVLDGYDTVWPSAGLPQHPVQQEYWEPVAQFPYTEKGHDEAVAFMNDRLGRGIECMMGVRVTWSKWRLG